MSARELADILRGALADSDRYIASHRVAGESGDSASTVVREVGSSTTKTGVYRVVIVREGTALASVEPSPRDVIVAALPSLSRALDALRTTDQGAFPARTAIDALSLAITMLAPAVTP
jgi:hypothetical protein